VLGLSAFAFGLLAAVAEKVPQLDPAKQHNNQANTYVYASDGHTILTILRGSQARIIVPSAAISPWMKHAIVAVEDKRFYEHRGVDIRGMGRALWADITHHGAVQGGSTITQQFVKNAYLSSKKTIGRKLFEAALAWQLEQKWTKDQILTAYLNTIYLGNHAYGVEQASRVYFKHSAKTLSPAESALLAAIPEDPSLYDPVAHPAAAKARRNLVLRDLYQQQYLTYGQLQAALKTPMPNPRSVSLPATQGNAAPYFANYVSDQLVHKYGEGKAFGGGLRVRTTLNVGLQQIARKAIISTLPSFASGDGPSAALVALDARTGEVYAMVGGPNYHKSQFNLATQGQRQPGSAFKPFVLAAALEQHIAPTSVLTSKPITIDAGGRLWQVHNYEGDYLGPIDLAKALAVSDNSVFSQLTALVGPPKVATAARSLGITSPLQGYFSIGLGSEWTTPLDMARAYASFADGGFRIDDSLFGNEPRTVVCLEDARGNCSAKTAPVLKPALGSRTDSEMRAEIMDQLLQTVVTSGTGTAAQIPGREVAGKTGTTENYGDAWFVGFTPQLVTAVWVGYPNSEQPMTNQFHGQPVVGGSYPALIWKAFMTQALDYLKEPPEDFTPPPALSSSLVTVVYRNNQLERDNGLCKDTFQLDYFSAQGPRLASCKVNEVQVPDVVGSTLAAAKQRLLQQPLETAVVYEPAKPGQKVGVVVTQFPKGGTLSSWQKVTVVLAKSLHGVVPKVVGLAATRAKARLAKLKVRVRVTGPQAGKVVSQFPAAGTALGPGVVVRLETAG
jgi:penicillin-binding protein 1A